MMQKKDAPKNFFRNFDVFSMSVLIRTRAASAKAPGIHN